MILKPPISHFPNKGIKRPDLTYYEDLTVVEFEDYLMHHRNSFYNSVKLEVPCAVSPKVLKELQVWMKKPWR